MVRVVKDPEERKEEIIDKSCQLFLAKGYDKTTMRDVMRECDIAKGTIYHYFSSKEQLLEAVLDKITATFIQEQKAVISSLEGDSLARLQHLILSSSNHDENEEIIENLHQPSNTGMHLRLMAKLVTQQAPLYGQLIEEGVSEGIFHTDSPLETAEFILAGVQFLVDLGIYPWSDEDILRRARAFPGLIEQQLGAPKGAFSFLLKTITADVQKNDVLHDNKRNTSQ